MLPNQVKQVPMAPEVCFDLIRHLMPDGLEKQKRLQSVIDTIHANATIALMCSLKASVLGGADMPSVDVNDFLLGMLSGVALAMSSLDNSPGSIASFLAHQKARQGGENVTNIAEAFKSGKRS